METNDANITHNVVAQENRPQHEDSISNTRNKEDVATLVHGGQYLITMDSSLSYALFCLGFG